MIIITVDTSRQVTANGVAIAAAMKSGCTSRFWYFIKKPSGDFQNFWQAFDIRALAHRHSRPLPAVRSTEDLGACPDDAQAAYDALIMRDLGRVAEWYAGLPA